jgi:ABC-type multidrug transport system ATPase subunit
MNNEEKIIEVVSLSKSFKDLLAVDDLHLNVYKGDVFGFLGPNGAGKSTTIRMMLSLIKPSKGTIKLFGKSLNRNRKDLLRKVGAIVESPDFYLYLSARKNLEILGRLSGTDVSTGKIMEHLDLVGLADRADSKVKTFSHGMKQRLGIAQALLHDPELIILDEPTTGLDPHGIKQIRDLIIYLSREKHKTIFISSHILQEVELIASRMIIINKGKTIVEGKVEDLLNAEKLKVKFDVDDTGKAEALIKESDWNGKFVESYNHSLIFELEHDEAASLNKYFVDSGVKVNAVIPTRSLEEYFLKITEESYT